LRDGGKFIFFLVLSFLKNKKKKGTHQGEEKGKQKSASSLW